ncbi:MAG: PTS sugar transporter subunit IIA [Pirellulales bacterium]
MASKDFDVDQLAAYLHLTPEQITKLASRGKLPGRRIGGEWKFSESEIHHWLEDKIGVSDIEQLGEMEQLLERTATADEESIVLANLMHVESIAIPLSSRTRSSVIRDMCQLVAQTGLLWDAESMAEAVLAREQLHPTALENGVALLHPRRPMASILAEPLLGLGITHQPLPFGNSAGHLTDIFFLICSTDDRVHLRILARLSRVLAEPGALDALRSVQSPQEAIEWMRTAESEWVASDS